MNKVLKFIFSRLFITSLLIAAQAATLILIIWRLSANYLFVNTLISIVAILIIINKSGNPSYKIAWIIPIVIFPVFGGLFYVMFGNTSKNSRFTRAYKKCEIQSESFILENAESLSELSKEDMTISAQSKYISDAAGFGVFHDTDTEYFSSGESMFYAMLEDMSKARNFIFLEFFILKPGFVLDTVVNLLEEKSKQGVKIKLLYDDLGTINSLPENFAPSLEKRGIEARAFNKMTALLSFKFNNRDHRKIVIIDGKTSYTGGMNLADEYINRIHPFGYWKDGGLRLSGNAVYNFTCMFLHSWRFSGGTEEPVSRYVPLIFPCNAADKTKGYVQPFGDSPLDTEIVSELAYMNMINRAKKYIYITTPYLIIDNEMITSLTLAAKSGVDVKIITPGIPDKKMVYLLTRSYYKELIENGVEIYEFTPGFIHTKEFVCDDETAIVGTINLDYRSLYLHFECGVWMYNTAAINSILSDYRETLIKSSKITLEWCRHRNIFARIMGAVLKIFAPLM